MRRVAGSKHVFGLWVGCLHYVNLLRDLTMTYIRITCTIVIRLLVKSKWSQDINDSSQQKNKFTKMDFHDKNCNKYLLILLKFSSFCHPVPTDDTTGITSDTYLPDIDPNDPGLAEYDAEKWFGVARQRALEGTKPAAGKMGKAGKGPGSSGSGTGPAGADTSGGFSSASSGEL
jgi:hypothetical protein